MKAFPSTEELAPGIGRLAMTASTLHSVLDLLDSVDVQYICGHPG